MRKIIGTVLGLAAVAGFAGYLAAQPVPTQVTSIGAADLVDIIPGGVGLPTARFAAAPLLGNYAATLPGNNFENYLIGGDAATNLFQRATSGASVTTTVTYGGPDRWAYWSGTNTAMTVSQDTTAGDITTTEKAAFKMARTAAQTGVVAVCMAQEVESNLSVSLAGQTAEIDFRAFPGATFSPTVPQVTAFLITGTATDEGMSKLAFGLNAGGGGGSGWTGQVNTGVVVPTPIGVNARYSVAIPVPATETEVGVAICFTPVGTAGANDYIALGEIQLTRNSALTAAAGTAGVALAANDTRIKAFARRPQAEESVLQQRYYYQLTETAAITPVAPCSAVDTTHTNCLIQFPVSMRAAPTATYANGFASPTSTTQATLGACTTLASATTVASTVLNPLNLLVNCTAGTIPAAGIASFLYSNGGTGTIKVTAEL